MLTNVKSKIIDKVANNLFKFSILLFIIGILWLINWPTLSKNTYMSENALLLNNANFHIGYDRIDELKNLSDQLNKEYGLTTNLINILNNLNIWIIALIRLKISPM